MMYILGPVDCKIIIIIKTVSPFFFSFFFFLQGHRSKSVYGGIVIESKGYCIFPEGYIELMHLSVYASITGFLQAGTGVQ